MAPTIREATPADAEQMSQILRVILASWKSERPSTAAHVLSHYVEDPEGIRCSVAVDADGTVIGFQALKLATDGNAYDLPLGWGIIGTYVDAKAAGRGVGKALFAASLAAARDAGVTEIDATIGETNMSGLAYYDAIGFRTYRSKPGAICKKFVLS